jgi:nucleotide-binding universal stress UspA family protein
MKNILLLLNATVTPPHVTDAAINLAKATSSLLHTFFINYDSDLAEYNYLFPNDLNLTRNTITGKTLAEENADLVASQVRLFTDQCRNAGVDFLVEPQRDIFLGDIISQSSFSDFILVDAHENMNEHHIADLLVTAHCPVYLVSKDAAIPASIILAYDGNPSSIYAAKLYSYLFPEFRQLPTHIVFAHTDREGILPHKKELMYLLHGHFDNFEVKMLRGQASEVLVDFSAGLPNPLMVMGSYGRNYLSRFFHQSHANKIIEEGKSSVFITHRA